MNELTLNITKTELLLTVGPIIAVDEIPAKQVSVSKSLGVQIDQNLNWENQIQMISKKIASGI